MTTNHLLLYRLAELMLHHEQHILPVDLLFDDEQIGDFIKSIQIDSPYQQMLLEGALTESVKEEKLYVSFTVEGYFHYVLGDVIYKQTEGKGAEALKQIVKESKLNGSYNGVEQCLTRDVQKGDLRRIIVLLSMADIDYNIMVNPFIVSIKNIGIIKTIDSVFCNAIANKWCFMTAVQNQLHNLQLMDLRISLLKYLMKNNPMRSDNEILFGIIAIRNLNNVDAINYQKKIKIRESNDAIMFQMGELYYELGLNSQGDYDMFNYSLNAHYKALEIRLNNYDFYLIIDSYISIAKLHWFNLDHDLSTEFYEKALNLIYDKIGLTSIYVGNVYKELANGYYEIEEFDISESMILKALEIFLFIYGTYHISVYECYLMLGQLKIINKRWEDALLLLDKSFELLNKVMINKNVVYIEIYESYASIYKELKNKNKTIEYLNDILHIKIECYGINHFNTARTYFDIAIQLYDYCDYTSALIYFQKSLLIKMETEPEDWLYEHFNYIGKCFYHNNQYKDAIEFLIKVNDSVWVDVSLIVTCYELLNEKKMAFTFLIKYAEKLREEDHIDDENIISVIQKLKELSLEINHFDLLPKWIKQIANNN